MADGEDARSGEAFISDSGKDFRGFEAAETSKAMSTFEFFLMLTIETVYLK